MRLIFLATDYYFSDDDVDMTNSVELEMTHENGAADQASAVVMRRGSSQTFPYRFAFYSTLDASLFNYTNLEKSSKK